MNTIQTILVAVSPTSNARDALEKAAVLARRAGARLELFLCDGERAFALNREYEKHGVERVRRACIEESRRYLKALSDIVDLTGLELTIDAACESPEYEGIVRKVLSCRPDLVIRNVSGGGLANPGLLSETDWNLIRSCPTLILLTRGRPWVQRPTVAAAIDISSDEAPEFARAVLQAAQYFSSQCEGELEVVNCIPHPVLSSEIEAQKYKLYDCVNQAGAQIRQLHVCAGEPTHMLPMVAQNKAYDLVVLRALTHQKTLSALVGTVTGKMLDAVACDFLLVKPAAYTCALAAEAPSRYSAKARTMNTARRRP